MGLAASPWSMKGSYSKATRVRSTLAWPPSGEAVDDAQHGGERSLTTRLDGRILLPADQFRPPLDRRLRHQHALERRSSDPVRLSRSASSKGRLLQASRASPRSRRRLSICVAIAPGCGCCSAPVKHILAPAEGLPPSTAHITWFLHGIRILLFVRVGVYCRFVNGTASATRAPCEQSP